MKKLIIVCLFFCGCSKNNDSKPSSFISFNNGSENITYAGNHPLASSTGIYYYNSTGSYPLNYEWIIEGAKSTSDYFAIAFFSPTQNITDSNLNEALAISYMVNGAFYSSVPFSPFTIHITSLQNNSLKGTFSGILVSDDNSDTLTISNGELVNVPFEHP